VIIFLGLSPITPSTSNPLDFEARKQMILADFPDVIVAYLRDLHDDNLWSKELDSQIENLITPTQTALLYGGRSSFIEHYTTGRWPTQELLQTEHYSGSAIRKQIARSKVKSSADFRAGVIWATQARFPTAFTTVDVAIVNEDQSKVLLGRKPNERQFRFIGGFSSPDSPTLEADARREVQEEAGVDIADPQYVGSTIVDDWRYRNEVDCIKTVLFLAKYRSGHPRPGDDIEEVRWFDFPVADEALIETHRPLMEMLTKETF
jgi:bifunctional NMN adenylyltransferase/nudix hydrolase